MSHTRMLACLHSYKLVVDRAAEPTLGLTDKMMSHRDYATALLAASTHQIQVCG